MKDQRTIATKAELECLQRLKKPIPGNGRRALLHRNRDLQTMLDLLFARVNEARDVIDEVARYFRIDPQESDSWLYAKGPEGQNPIMTKITNTQKGGCSDAKG